MIEGPGIEIVAEPSPQWHFAGPLGGRVRDIARQARDRCLDSAELPTLAPGKIEVVSAPPEHVGLGVGTQLGLAVVRALLALSGCPDPCTETLARLAGRGRRSGIGTHGFAHGGLIVDGGRHEGIQLPPLVARLPFPGEWSILLVQPPEPRGRHGSDELAAFSGVLPPPERVTERLCRLILLGILPAVVERDLQTFGAALSELQHHVGTAFAPVQGGIYASTLSASIVTIMEQLGLVGAGQSSWGPTLYAFGSISESEQSLLSSRLRDRCDLDPSCFTWTRAENHGAKEIAEDVRSETA
jgi:beta-RFAP synthase